jgi:hypothetical protein
MSRLLMHSGTPPRGCRLTFGSLLPIKRFVRLLSASELLYWPTQVGGLRSAPRTRDIAKHSSPAPALVLDRLHNRKPNGPRCTTATALRPDDAPPRFANHFGIMIFDFQFTAAVDAAHRFGPALDQDRRLDGNWPIRSATGLQPSNALASLRLHRRFAFGFTPGRARSGFRLAHGASLPHLIELAVT